jgi:hypothetical protein
VAYGQRTDLNAQRTLPVRAVPGQTYGARTQQINAQRLVPMGPPPGPPAPLGAPAAATQQAGGPMVPPFPPAGSLGDIHRPTERPNEPVTAGAALGPGPGPEAMPAPQAVAPGSLSSLLANAAQATGSGNLRALASQAAANGQ